MVINKKLRRNARKPDQKREKSIRKRKKSTGFPVVPPRILVFYQTSSLFCRQEPYLSTPFRDSCRIPQAHEHMFQDMTEKFTAITAFLAATDWNACFTLTFEDVCRRFDADRRRADNMMYEVFGMSGDEMIRQYRNGGMDEHFVKNLH